MGRENGWPMKESKAKAEYKRRWARENREKMREFHRRSRERHRESINAKARAKQKEHPEIARRRVAEWRKANPERNKAIRDVWRAANPEKVSATNKRYTATSRSRENRVRLQRNRELRVAGVPGRGISRHQWRRSLAGALGLCAYCNCGGRLTLDHIDPISKGGEHDIENAAVACNRCNSSKGDTPLLLWLATRSAHATPR